MSLLNFQQRVSCKGVCITFSFVGWLDVCWSSAVLVSVLGVLCVCVCCAETCQVLFS